ncbi:MAG TPA: aminodeoxychorismate lyase [Solimonas sp.]
MSAGTLYNGGAASVEALLQSRALHYGDGVFRTLLIWKGQVHDAERQCAHLAADARRLDLIPPATATLRHEMDQLASGRERSVLKILLWRQARERGYAPRTQECERLLMTTDAPRYADTCWSEGIVAIRSPQRLATPAPLPGIKHLARLEQVLASRDWPDGVQEALMADADDRPICGTRSNLFWVCEDRLNTPPLDRCGVRGATRERVLALSDALGIAVREVHTDWPTLEAADDVFVTNSLIGLWPLQALGERRWPTPGPVTRQLMQALDHPRLC